MAFANDDSVKMSKVKENKAVNKSKYDARGPQSQAGNQSYSGVIPSHQARPGEKCDCFNRGYCSNPNCGCEHICYCGEAGHNALNCPKLHGSIPGSAAQ